jgi:hypothetical protein
LEADLRSGQNKTAGHIARTGIKQEIFDGAVEEYIPFWKEAIEATLQVETNTVACNTSENSI